MDYSNKQWGTTSDNTEVTFPMNSNKQWGLVNILQNQQTIIKELNISWSYCIACACVLEEAGQFSLIKWLDKQSNGHSIKFMSQNKVTDENGVWFSFIGIGKY